MYIGIDIGGTKTSFALADNSGKIIAKSKSPSGLYDGTWHNVLISGIANLTTEAKVTLKTIKAIGAGAPDLTVESKDKKTTLRELVKSFLEDKFRVPVRVENDASVAALGELYRGAGKGKKNFVYLILGTGIGGAAVIDGKLYTGATGRAGEFGHMSVEANGPKCGCGNRGCLHLFASGDAIAKRALAEIARRKALKSKILELAGEFKDPKELAKKITAEVVVEAAKQKDLLATEVLAESMVYLGTGIINLINIFNPEIVIVGGGLAEGGEVILAPLNQIVKQGVRKELFGEVEVVRSSLGDEAGLLGAIMLATKG